MTSGRRSGGTLGAVKQVTLRKTRGNDFAELRGTMSVLWSLCGACVYICIKKENAAQRFKRYRRRLESRVSLCGKLIGPRVAPPSGGSVSVPPADRESPFATKLTSSVILHPFSFLVSASSRPLRARGCNSLDSALLPYVAR